MASCQAPLTLGHHIFTESGWERAQSFSHPTVTLKLSTNEEDYRRFNYPYKKIQEQTITVVADSGAQSCLWSRKGCIENGFKKNDLIPVVHRMSSANSSPITIDGAVIVRLVGYTKDNIKIEAAAIVYISPESNNFYLSKEAMVQLKIINRTFPEVGSALNSTSHVMVSSVSDTVADCGCKKRTKSPARPTVLPFEPTLENAEKMKQWLLDYYGSSTFNQCEHQILPDMDGPDLEIHVNADAKFVNFTTPATVPLHWQEKVKNDLDRDVTMGVLEKVPYGEPTRVCHRMITVRKHNGDPRRVVGLDPLNAHCQRETYPSESPFHLARAVPSNSTMTVLDAWNGFHLIRIRESDRWLTTFITQWGLYRYLRAVQGFLSSGDGFNRRFDEITKHIVRLLRCIDDSLLHDKNTEVEVHWWRVIEFLEVCGNSGVVCNREKFQFSQPKVEFAGFRITQDTVEPLPKYLDAIREYPTPKNISDVRSWFGLVNQVSHYGQLREMMEPFRKFLSPKCKFEWTDELDNLFNESKKKIVAAIEEGVKIFDLLKRTCLRTDWSKSGIGFWLLQKHCDCEVNSPGCCTDGWQITLASSRFLKSAERNYAAVEGEALGVAWGLEQTKFFTMGCNNLLVVVDHAPLVKLLGDRRLDEIENPRLFRLKQRTLRWRFEIEYQPGKSNHASDALSRYPNRYSELASLSLQSEEDQEEELIIARIGTELHDFFSVTLDCVAEASEKDKVIQTVVKYVVKGFPSSKGDMDCGTDEYWRYKDKLTAISPILFYDERVVIPMILRAKVLENLHSAHQCISSMSARAQVTFFWPGLSNEIERLREECRQCHTNAPTQAKMPPTTDIKIPTSPFEMIFSDYFQLHGFYYLIAGDRFSGWTEVVQVRPGTQSSGAKGLCSALRRLFALFGVPVEISSDGGPEYEAHEFAVFLMRWGTRHRKSSAYLPASNGRAEVAVKQTKRLLQCNVGPSGSLDTDKVVRALLQLRNTPDRDAKVSPAQILFGRPLRDTMPYLSKSTQVFDNIDIQEKWREAWNAKEDALRYRHRQNTAHLSEHTKMLPSLEAGTDVYIQNQDTSSKHYKKWDRMGTIVEVGDHDQYLVRMEGTGRPSVRNRRFLRKVKVKPKVPNPIVLRPLVAKDVTVEPTTCQPTNPQPSSEIDREEESSTTPQHPAQEPTEDLRETSTRSETLTPIPTTPNSTTTTSPQLRRSSRARKAVTVYDPSTGTYVEPSG